MNTTNEISIEKLDGSINTYLKGKINLINPHASQINIADIARGLANNPHFAGQTPRFFSIAEHCLLVCDFMEAAGISDKNLLLIGLLHDASKAYLGDMVKPLKVFIPEFQRIEENMMQVIFNKFDLPIEWIKKVVKQFDIEAQQLEYDCFYKGINAMNYYSPDKAYTEFIKRFNYYQQL